VIPHFQERVLAEDVDFAGHQGDFAETRLNQDSALRIEFGGQSIEIDAVEKFLPRRVYRGHSSKASFKFQPDRHRVNANGLTGKARDKDLRAVLLVNQGTERVGDL